MDTTLALTGTPSKLVGICRALAALPGFVRAVEEIITLVGMPVTAEISSVASALSVLGLLRIFVFVYGRFARRAVENECERAA